MPVHVCVCVAMQCSMQALSYIQGEYVVHRGWRIRIGWETGGQDRIRQGGKRSCVWLSERVSGGLLVLGSLLHSGENRRLITCLAVHVRQRQAKRHLVTAGSATGREVSALA